MTEKTTAAKRKSKKKFLQAEIILTDFSEAPIIGNPNNVEVGDCVTLTRSMIMLDGNALWLRGVDFKIEKLHTLDSGLIIADVKRSDGIEGSRAKFYACWLEPIFEES